MFKLAGSRENFVDVLLGRLLVLSWLSCSALSSLGKIPAIEFYLLGHTT